MTVYNDFTKITNPRYYRNTNGSLLSWEDYWPPLFRMEEGDTLSKTFVSSNSVPSKDILENLLPHEVAAIEEIARSKFLTSFQIFQFLNLRGYSVSHTALKEILYKLVELKVLQEYTLSNSDDSLTCCYCLDRKGCTIAQLCGILFHSGNRFTDLASRKDLCYAYAPRDIKRTLLGNQIIINLLLGNCKMQEFGMLKAFAPVIFQGDDELSIYYCASYITVSSDSVLVFDVIRDDDKSLFSMLNRLKQYYNILHTDEYLNYQDVNAYPQLILCGENLDCNMKFARLMKASDLWREEDPVLFTEDSLLYQTPLQAFYTLDDSKQTWYELPENISL